MKAEMINPFITATVNVFHTMTGFEPVKQDIFLQKDEKAAYDISAIIGLAGKLQGYIVLSFPEELAFKIVSQFLGEQKTEMSDDVIDAVGEFINMIAGSSKRVFAEQGLRYNIGIPSVVTGKGHTIRRPSNIPCIGINFKVEEQSFTVEIALKENLGE